VTLESGHGIALVCPSPECPPTEFEPVDVTTSEDDVATAVCGGECGKTYPRSAFQRVAP
jgi:hypothetical protein